MRNVTPTVLGAALQTARSLGVLYHQDENSTLNEAVRLIPGYVASKEPVHVDGPVANHYDPVRDTGNMVMSYITIGMNALAIKTNAQDRVSVIPVPHKVTDTGWYEPLPFALIRTGAGEDDLSVAERAKYRLRRTIMVNGEECTAYYLRVLDHTDVSVRKEHYHYEDGNKSDPVVWAPTQVDLKPPRPSLPSNNVLPNNGDYYSVVAPFVVEFNATELQRIADAVELLTGDPAEAIISEIGFVSAADVKVQLTDSNGNLSGSFDDVLGAQVDSWYVCNEAVYGRESLRLQFNAGRAEPLYGTSP